MKYLKYFESFNFSEIMKVVNPHLLSETEFSVFKTLSLAEQHIEQLNKDIGSQRPNQAQKAEISIIKNTAEYNIGICRVKYKTNEPLEMFDHIMGWKNKWDKIKIKEDPDYNRAENILKDVFYLETIGSMTDEERDKLKKQNDELADKLKNQKSSEDSGDLIEFEDEDDEKDSIKNIISKHYSNWSREDLLKKTDLEIREMSPQLIEEIVDRALESPIDKEILDKFHKYYPQSKSKNTNEKNMKYLEFFWDNLG